MKNRGKRTFKNKKNIKKRPKVRTNIKNINIAGAVINENPTIFSIRMSATTKKSLYQRIVNKLSARLYYNKKPKDSNEKDIKEFMEERKAFQASTDRNMFLTRKAETILDPYLKYLSKDTRDNEPPWYQCGNCTSNPRNGVCIFGHCCTGQATYDFGSGKVTSWSITCGKDIGSIH
tara:strand:- start:2476 stop:3003 length:528 start_codon:yes stop_codon:yes gene_type:complete